MSSITRVLHTTTWDFFATYLPDHFSNSPKEVKEAIMVDISDLVEEFWRTSSDADVGASLFAMRRLFAILQECFEDVISVFVTAVDLADKIIQTNVHSFSPQSRNRIKIKVTD